MSKGAAIYCRNGFTLLRKSVKNNIFTVKMSSTSLQASRRRKYRKRTRRTSGESESKLEDGASCSVPSAHPQKKTKFFDEEMYNETSYYMENGLRKVHPYHYTFATHCKGRWVGITLHDVFKREFRSESPEYYAAAINSGMITVNGCKAGLEYVMKNNDFMQSRVHRHEPPVTGKPIDIIECNEDILVINKPASIPVHPSGRYRHNTIMFLLGKEHNFRNLHTIHRLDRLTSGLLMFARSLEMSQKLDSYVRGRHLQKTYVSRVRGEFPSEPVVCSEPIITMSHKIGVCRVSPDGKPCKTEFYRMSYNGTSSVVKCLPHTGRMHQIRVHLQYLGYPILNDPLYTSSAWGPNTGKGGVIDKTCDEILADLIEAHSRENQATVIEDGTDSLAEILRGKVKSTEVQDERDQDIKEAVAGEEMEKAGGKGDVETESCVKRESDKGADREMPAAEGGVEKEGETGRAARDHEKADRKQEASRETVEAAECAESECGTEEFKCDSGRIGMGVNSTADSDCVSADTDTRQNPIEIREQSEKSACTQGDGDINASQQTQLQKLSECAMDPLCKECRLRHRDPLPHEMVMYLHALSYKGPDFEYSTPMPDWASEDWEEPQS